MFNTYKCSLCCSDIGHGNNNTVLLACDCVIVSNTFISYVCVHVQACAHLWKNVFYAKKDSQNHKLPHGVCYLYSNDLSHSQYMIPCYRGTHTHTHNVCTGSIC